MGYRERDVTNRGILGGIAGTAASIPPGAALGTACCPGPGTAAGVGAGIIAGVISAIGGGAGAWLGINSVRNECGTYCSATKDAPFDYERYEKYQGCMSDLRSKWDASHPPRCYFGAGGPPVIVPEAPSADEIKQWQRECAKRSR